MVVFMAAEAALVHAPVRRYAAIGHAVPQQIEVNPLALRMLADGA